MESFLSKVVAKVLSSEKIDLKNTVFVLPSQRACVFIKEELISQIRSVSFLPKMVSIENFIQDLAEIKQIDTIQLLFEFYSIYLKCTEKEHQESFDVFSQWATIVLQDFNEVDRHLIDTNDLFLYLRDINRLRNWSPTTEITKNYFSFFEKLDLYYNKFYASLKSRNLGYQGLIYREAESNIQHFIDNNQEKHIVFVGFNALNKAEELIFQELLQNGLASIYWDVDKSYMSKARETGVFLRKYKAEWNYFHKHPFNWIENYFDDTKNIHFVGTPKNVGQLKYVGSLFEKIDNLQNTALVLADESLLTLSLNSLPKNVDKINITMGYPLKDIPLASFFNSIFNLYLNQERFNLKDKNTFYYKDVLHIFNDISFNKLLNIQNNYSNKVGKSNKIFLSKVEITTFFNEERVEEMELIDLLFSSNNQSVKTILDRFINLCNTLKDIVTGTEKEYVYRFYTIFLQLQNLNKTFGYLKNIKTLQQFFEQLLKSETLSFQGEPLEGLQLMGMLETRVIDFETVIITSVNEGVLPSSKSDQSFIPFDVKKHFNLPTYQEKDAIFSYHFYRLLHRAKNIYLIYNTENDVFGSGEKSRFLTQLEIQRNDIQHQIISPKVTIQNSELKEIFKTEGVLKSLKNLAKKGISPSAITSYINNPIAFYYQKILKIKDINEVEETIAVNTMGTVIHTTLEQLYLPFIDKILTVDSVKDMLNQTENLVEQNFKNEYKNGDFTKGKNKLIFEVSKKYIIRFLQNEISEIKRGKQIKIIALEQNLMTHVELGSVNFPIKLHGIIDRVDQVDGVLRIIDYKTGMVQESQLKINDFSKMKGDYKYTKALQIMLYAYLFTQNNDFVNLPFEAGIFSFKNLNKGLIKMNFSEKRNGKDFEINIDRLGDFLEDFKDILTEIFDPNTPFVENSNKAY